jgi:SAM-dependent methyltransferase
MEPRNSNLENSVCPACGKTGGRSRGRKNDFHLLSCESCGTLYAAYAPGTSHSHNYDAYYTAENLTVPTFITSIVDGIVATFEPYRKTNRLLDVGCGAGTFLEAAARAGWEATGLEVSRTAAEHVSARGFEVFCGELEKANYPDEHFDVVILSEVLEHVPNPRSLLEASARVLRSGGLLWGTTPHGRGISARLLGLEWSTVCPPEHLQLFSIRGIKALSKGLGLDSIKVATHGTNPFEIVHGLRHRCNQAEPKTGGVTDESFNRVESSYQLNEKLSGGRAGRLLKGMLNNLLNATRMGDSLKIQAEKYRP